MFLVITAFLIVSLIISAVTSNRETKKHLLHQYADFNFFGD